MDAPVNEHQEELKKSFLKVIQGGKEPPYHNWLLDLPVGTSFLFKPRTDIGCVATEGTVLTQEQGVATLLEIENFTNKPDKIWVVTRTFSRINERVVTIEYPLDPNEVIPPWEE